MLKVGEDRIGRVAIPIRNGLNSTDAMWADKQSKSLKSMCLLIFFPPTIFRIFIVACMTSFLYFAYGSNMLTQRLTARCAGAVPLGKALARDHQVGFFLKGADGSAKAGMVPKKGAQSWGVLFEMPLAEQGVLDGFEGEGEYYARETIPIMHDFQGIVAEAVTYLAHSEHLTNALLPFDWYRALCAGGATQHRLPAKTLEKISSHDVFAGPYVSAGAAEGHSLALQALHAAGFADETGNLLL